MQKLNVYIVHSKSLEQRTQRVNDLKKKLNEHSYKHVKIDKITVITENDPEDITGEIIQTSVNYEPPQDERLKPFAAFTKNLHVNQLSQVLKYKTALQDIVSSKNDVWGMIVEDDSLYQEPLVCEHIDRMFSQINSITDVDTALVHLGMPVPQQPDTSKSIVKVNRDEYNLIPVVENFMIHKKMAAKMLSVITPVKFSFNVQMNYIIAMLGCVCWQSMFPLFINGSKYGAYISSTNASGPLVFNKEYMMMFDIIKRIEQGETTVADNVHKFAELVAQSSQFIQHPEFVHVIAKFKVLQGKYQEANKLLNACLENLETNKAIVNHDSWILRDLIRLQKHIQVI